jgi:hypothetical protein
MEGDYSRDTFDAIKHFSRVLMQQGRVQLDADWNEQASIGLHYLRTLAADLIGPHGGPANELGFEITAKDPASPPTFADLLIGPGRYYVDGILCENEGITERVRSSGEGIAQEIIPVAEATLARKRLPEIVGNERLPISYFKQPDYPLDPEKNDDVRLPEAALLVYLDVWERDITYIEDDSIREVALGGPDTAARTKVVWQVKITALEELVNSVDAEKVTCDSPVLAGVMRALEDRLQPANHGLMAARAQVPEDTDDANVCIVSPEASYRGAENQLYRVEIHHGGDAWDGHTEGDGARATFKWSRDNGAVVFAIQSLSGRTVTLESLGRDDRFGLEVGDWVEVVDDDYVLLGKEEHLLRVEAIDRIDLRVTLSGAPKYGQAASKHPLLRRWDQQAGDPAIGGLQLVSEGTALVVGSDTAWLNLEDGVQVRFTPGAKYRTGDYWLIPARTATGDIVWPGPTNQRPALPPHGVEHHYAPLAVALSEDGRGYRVKDLRHSVAPLRSCCPKIEILNPPTWSKPANKPIPFKARVRGRNTVLKYNWRIQGGIIVDSRATDPSIQVAPAVDSTAVIAIVVIEGLAGDCPNSAMAACALVQEPS